MQCTNNVKQLSLALHNYHDVNNAFPNDGYTSYKENGGQNGTLGVHTRLLPFYEQGSLYGQVFFTQNYTYGSVGKIYNYALGLTRVPTLLCPSSTNVYARAAWATTPLPPPEPNGERATDTSPNQWYTTHYYGSCGAETPNYYRIKGADGTEFNDNNGAACGNGIMSPGPNRGFDAIVDGTSNTFAFGEISWNLMALRGWHRGIYFNHAADADTNKSAALLSVRTFRTDWTLNLGKKRLVADDWSTGSGVLRFAQLKTVGAWSSEHSGGGQFGLADGSVRFVSENLSGDVLCAYGAIDDGQNYTLP